MAHDRLTAKQQAFLTEYLRNGRIAAAAYRKAYGTASPARAQESGYRLLSHPLISPIVQQARDKAAAEIIQVIDKYAVSEKTIVEGLARLAFSDIRSVSSWDKRGARFKPSSSLTDEEAFPITEVTHTIDAQGNPTMKIKLADKRAALVDLGRYKQLFTEKTEVTMKGDFASMLGAARKRSAGGG